MFFVSFRDRFTVNLSSGLRIRCCQLHLAGFGRPAADDGRVGNDPPAVHAMGRHFRSHECAGAIPGPRPATSVGR